MACRAHIPAQGLQSWPVACLHPREGCQQPLLQVPDVGEWLGSGEDDWVSAHPCRWPSICPLSPVALTSGHITGHRGTASPGCGTSPRRHSKNNVITMSASLTDPRLMVEAMRVSAPPTHPCRGGPSLLQAHRVHTHHCVVSPSGCQKTATFSGLFIFPGPSTCVQTAET